MATGSHRSPGSGPLEAHTRSGRKHCLDLWARNSYHIGMRTTAVVSEKGQVTIPKRLRAALGIAPGSELEFHEQDGRLVATCVVTGDPFVAMVGLGQGRDADAVLTALRGPGRNRKTGGR